MTRPHELATQGQEDSIHSHLNPRREQRTLEALALQAS